MPFHLGKPILVMSILAVAAGITGALTRRDRGRAEIEHWAFSEQNWRLIAQRSGTGESLVERFERETGHSADSKLIQYRAMNTRLSSLFQSRTGWPELPDVIDLEVGSVGRYFRPPVDEMGLMPLDDLIDKHGWRGRILENRLATWSKDGVIFGIPQDVHPVMIAYNDARFRAAGVDLASSETWDDFVANCVKAQAYWRANGEPRANAFEMWESSAGTIITMLLQRGVNLVDQDGTVRLTDEKTLDTLVRYCLMLEGPEAGRIGVSTSPGSDAFSQDLPHGYVNAMLCADWRLRYLRDYGSAMAGQMRVMPMPRWPDSPYRTSTFGGSMVGIPRDARDPELSWRYIETTYLSQASAKARAEGTYVVPAVPELWDQSTADVPDPYYGGQAVRRMVFDLAADVPPRYVSPTSSVAEVEMSRALISALAYTREHRDTDLSGLREHCKSVLEGAAGRLRRQVDHARFDK